MIPAHTEKPGDPRLIKKMPGKHLFSDLAYVVDATTRPLPRDNPDALLDIISKEWLRLYCEGALAYYRSDYKKVIQCFRKLGDGAAKLRFCPMAIAAVIAAGDYSLYLEIEAFCKDLIKADISANVTTVAEYALSVAYMGAFAPDMVPNWVKNGDFSALSATLRPEAICMKTRYLHYLKKYESVLEVARTALAFDEPELGISYPSFFLRAMCAAACCSLGRMGEAEQYLLEAMNICLPHGFIAPFVELGPLFCGLLEKLLEQYFPAYYDTVTELSERTVTNWLSFHNRFTKDNITLILSSREYQMARLAAQGVPYKKIAEQYYISLGTLNNKMQVIYQKLFISVKKDLEKYLL